jgi:hypothetical protein
MLSCSASKPGKDYQLEETDFDRETARLAVRMLTARAAGMVLQNVSHVDDFKAAWLQEHFKQVGSSGTCRTGADSCQITSCRTSAHPTRVH